MVASPYSYDRVPPGCIRLLRPERVSCVTIHTRLTFTLHIFPIEAAPPYTAVSYVWGSGSASQAIYLNDRTFVVRQNLWSCLHYLVQAANFWQERLWDYLWVDAICINQSDGEEKNQQVRAMNRVYSNAVEVTAWLGLQRLPGWIQWREAAAKTSEHGDWLLNENVLDVAERPYWTRMWIVQELLLAQRIRFQISGQSFDFDHFADVVDKKQLSGTEDLRQLLAYTKARRADHGHPHRPLWELLLDFGTCQCQDPRDNVFALLSLLSYSDQDALSSFFPDYTLTHDAVVIITLHHLQNHYREEISHIMKRVLDSLGVSPSQLVRRRLVAASEVFDVYYDSALSQGIDFLKMKDEEYEEDAFQSTPPINSDAPTQSGSPMQPRRSFFINAAVNVWWVFTGCGIFEVRRSPHRQALADVAAEYGGLLAQQEQARRWARGMYEGQYSVDARYAARAANGAY